MLLVCRKEGRRTGLTDAKKKGRLRRLKAGKKAGRARNSQYLARRMAASTRLIEQGRGDQWHC
jgi:hypothetical protein